jgi:hypothetical protein
MKRQLDSIAMQRKITMKEEIRRDRRLEKRRERKRKIEKELAAKYSNSGSSRSPSREKDGKKRKKKKDKGSGRDSTTDGSGGDSDASQKSVSMPAPGSKSASPKAGSPSAGGVSPVGSQRSSPRGSPDTAKKAMLQRSATWNKVASKKGEIRKQGVQDDWIDPDLDANSKYQTQSAALAAHSKRRVCVEARNTQLAIEAERNSPTHPRVIAAKKDPAVLRLLGPKFADISELVLEAAQPKQYQAPRKDSDTTRRSTETGPLVDPEEVVKSAVLLPDPRDPERTMRSAAQRGVGGGKGGKGGKRSPGSKSPGSKSTGSKSASPTPRRSARGSDSASRGDGAQKSDQKTDTQSASAKAPEQSAEELARELRSIKRGVQGREKDVMPRLESLAKQMVLEGERKVEGKLAGTAGKKKKADDADSSDSEGLYDEESGGKLKIPAPLENVDDLFEAESKLNPIRTSAKKVHDKGRRAEDAGGLGDLMKRYSQREIDELEEINKKAEQVRQYNERRKNASSKELIRGPKNDLDYRGEYGQGRSPSASEKPWWESRPGERLWLDSIAPGGANDKRFKGAEDIIEVIPASNTEKYQLNTFGQASKPWQTLNNASQKAGQEAQNNYRTHHRLLKKNPQKRTGGSGIALGGEKYVTIRN